MKPNRKRRWIVLVILVMVVAGAGAAYKSLGNTPTAIGANSLATVTRGDIARSVVATGVVEPISNRIEIRSKASGIVKKVYVDVGDPVQPGQVLVDLDRDQLMAQLREAEANLLASKADLTAARAQLDRNRILAEGYDVELAKSNHERSVELVKQKLISQADFDATRGRLEEALNRQRAAAAAMTVSQATIEQKQAGVAQMQAIVDRITDDLGYATIRSPIKGVVLSREVEVGSAVSSILTMGAGADPGHDPGRYEGRLR